MYPPPESAAVLESDESDQVDVSPSTAGPRPGPFAHLPLRLFTANTGEALCICTRTAETVLRSDGGQKDTCLSLWVCAGFAVECTAGFKNPTQLLSCKRAVLTSVPLQLLPVPRSLHTGLSERSLRTATTFTNVALSQMAHMLSLTASSVSRPTSEQTLQIA